MTEHRLTIRARPVAVAPAVPAAEAPAVAADVLAPAAAVDSMQPTNRRVRVYGPTKLTWGSPATPCSVYQGSMPMKLALWGAQASIAFVIMAASVREQYWGGKGQRESTAESERAGRGRGS